MGVLAKAAGSLWDWIEAGYPEEVAKRIVSGELPMDEASRMARAAEQGYGDVLHRGHSNQSVPHSDQDMWLSDSHYVAQTYADAHGAAGKVTPLRTNADYHGPNNLAYVRGDHKMHDKVTTNSIKNPGIRQGIIKGTDDIAEAVKESGLYQGTHFRGIKDEFHTASSTDPSDVYNILGSRPDVNIRHADAAYDPKYTGPNIMGNATVPALGVLATGTGAALAAPALKSEGLEKATGFLDETIRSARHAAGPFSFLVPYEGISNFAKKWNADEDLTWQDYLGLLDF